jgi:hypothetical protein
MNLKNLNPDGGERGSALMMVLVTTMLVLAFIVAFERWTGQHMRQAVHRNGAERAVLCAQQKTDQVKEALRDPTVWNTPSLAFPNGLLPGAIGTTPNTQCAPDPAWAQSTVSRDVSDSSLVDIYTTAYFEIANGNFVNFYHNNLPASMAVVESKIRARSVGEFFAAVPTLLQVSAGLDLRNASVYARDLVFQAQTGAPLTQVKNAYYFNSVRFVPGTVSFTNAGAAPIHLKSEPNIAMLDSALRNMYLQWAQSQSPADVLASPTLTALPTPANSYGVLFYTGNLDLGPPNGTLATSNQIVLYVAGNVTIHSSIVPAGSGWLAVVAEGDIVLAADVPVNATLQGTFVTARSLYANPPQRVGTLNFIGGFDAQLGASLTPGWKTRNYTYSPPPAAAGRGAILLPFFTSVEQYRVVQGKFSQ